MKYLITILLAGLIFVPAWVVLTTKVPQAATKSSPTPMESVVDSPTISPSPSPSVEPSATPTVSPSPVESVMPTVAPVLRIQKTGERDEDEDD